MHAVFLADSIATPDHAMVCKKVAKETQMRPEEMSDTPIDCRAGGLGPLLGHVVPSRWTANIFTPQVRRRPRSTLTFQKSARVESVLCVASGCMAAWSEGGQCGGGGGWQRLGGDHSTAYRDTTAPTSLLTLALATKSYNVKYTSLAIDTSLCCGSRGSV